MNAYPIVNPWRKGAYIALITGRHDKYGFDREFLQGRPIKTRGIVAYEVRDIGTVPAWLIQTDGNGTRDIIEATELGWTNHGGMTTAGFIEVYEHGLPGTPDAWTGERCCDCHEAPTFPDGATRCPQCLAGTIGRNQALVTAGDAPTPF